MAGVKHSKPKENDKMRLSSVILILVLAAVGYNFYQVGQLRKELRAMGQEISAVESSRTSTVDVELVEAIASAREHGKNASDLLEKGKTKQAKTELDMSLKMMEKAFKLSDTGGREPGIGIDQALNRIRAEVEKAWRDFSSEAKKRGPE